MPYNCTNDWPENPHRLFEIWMRDAEKAEPNDPNAMCLATLSEDNFPDARMVLLKDHDERGFVFYTNAESQKGAQLAANMKASLCFYWKSLKKQIRIQGHVELIDQEEADQYFNSRHRGSRIGAWASKQSRPMDHRKEFEERLKHYEQKFEGEETIPRPDYWKGYRVKPEKIEFWMDEKFRLHRRCVFRHKSDGTWSKTMLFP